MPLTILKTNDGQNITAEYPSLPLGRGGTGTAFLAILRNSDEVNGREVVLKFTNTLLSTTETSKLLSLNHQNVVKYIDVMTFLDGGKGIALAMENCCGK